MYGSFITGNLNKQTNKQTNKKNEELHTVLAGTCKLSAYFSISEWVQDILRGPLKHLQILRSSSPEPSQANQVLNWEHSCDRDQVKTKTKAGWGRVQTRTGPLHWHENVEHGNDRQSLNWYVRSKSLSNTHRNLINLTFSGVLVHH